VTLRIFEIAESSSTSLAKKNVDRLFFGVKRGATSDQMVDLIGKMDKLLDVFCVVHMSDADES
jgi:hypothetical protein